MRTVDATICICHSPFMDFATLSLPEHGIIFHDTKYAKKIEHCSMYTLGKISLCKQLFQNTGSLKKKDFMK